MRSLNWSIAAGHAIFNDARTNHSTAIVEENVQLMGDITYFTCTLGEAAKLPPSPFRTVNELIEFNAVHHGHELAIGFPDGGASIDGHDWSFRAYTFGELRERIRQFALLYHKILGNGPRTIALLSASDATFFWTWLALIRLGHAVLLIAPELSPLAVGNLCRDSEAHTILYDRKNASIAEQATVESHEEFKISGLELIEEPDTVQGVSIDIESVPDVTPDHAAYIHHTSGSSTGRPKPIVISHYGAVGVLPRLYEEVSKTTLTTTPLYHGGPADTFRAWASGAMIWLYPGIRDKPITSGNILQAVKAIRQSLDLSRPLPKICYFTSVPYVLEMLSKDPLGLEFLQSLELVGVGGAALSLSSGNALTAQGVNLISRYGSAECGFMLCSRRDYALDKAWNYMRDPGISSLKFEPHGDDGLTEVVVKDWPLMAKQNMEDGSFATSDLFEAHDSIKGAWRYHSRADAQMTLKSGLKFDPASVESRITESLAGLDKVEDVYVTGTGRLCPALLIFLTPQSKFEDIAVVSQRVEKSMKEINRDLPPFAQISRAMTRILSGDDLKSKLVKSNKGTVLRPQSDQALVYVIEAIYDQGNSINSTKRKVIEPTEISFLVQQSLIDVVSDKFSSSGSENDSSREIESPLLSADFFDLGITSMECMQIRARLITHFGQFGELPLNIVYDCGTVEKLTNFIQDLSRGIFNSDPKTQEDLMLQLVEQYGCNAPEPLASDDDLSRRSSLFDDFVVILTGVTGTLGAHIFDLLRLDRRVKEIHCLIRASSSHVSMQRLAKSLAQRRLSPLTPGRPAIFCWTCNISDEKSLGLDPEDYEVLRNKATHIIHAAWEVNFSLSLSSFVKTHIRGLHNLLEFGRRTRHFVFCSSTASVLGPNVQSGSSIAEKVSKTPSDASPLGYSQSKWVAEAICNSYHENSILRDRISILRIGQLCGDDQHGIWNVTEAWPLMFSSMAVTHKFPDLHGQRLDWLKVNIAAKAILEITFDDDACGRQMDSLTDSKDEVNGSNVDCPVFHILNPNATPRWSDLIGWIRKSNPDIKIVSAQDWIRSLESLEGKNAAHPSRKLLGLWKSAYGQSTDQKDNAEAADGPIFEMNATQKRAHCMRNIEPLSENFIQKIWAWLDDANKDILAE